MNTEPEDAPLNDMDSAAAAFGDYFSSQEGGDLPADAEDDEDENSSGEGDEDALELDGEDAGDEPEDAPAIDPPASLTAEEKALFAQLPSEAQRLMNEVESRRNGQVQTATTKAAEAQRQAETRAAQADAQAKAVYAQQLQAFAEHLAPQAPDPQLAQTDPVLFIQLQAQYEAGRAQHNAFVQQVQSLGAEAEIALTQAEVAERDSQLMAIPEVQNPETRAKFFEKALAAAKVLGLDPNGVNRATATELKALRQISDWKDDAEKYHAAMARQMQRVREGKKVTSAKPNAARPDGKGFEGSMKRLKQTGDLQDAANAFARLSR